MIKKINELKSKTNLKEVKTLCETAIGALSSTIYNNVTPEAKFEIERVAITDLFEGLKTFKNKGVKKWLSKEKRLYTIRNLGIRETINTLSKESETEGLDEILEKYKDYLNAGVSETLLYEDYTSALQSFSYFPRVGNAIKAVKDRVDSYKSDIDITKILETMKTTRSKYLVPLIEDVVTNYLNDKNEESKHQLKETLIKFTYDPFVRDIVSAVTLDATDLQLEYANSESDIEKLYSPIMYIGEKETVFNVKGGYYIKKGNNINRLPEKDHKKLDKEFVALCETINDDNVVFNKSDITFYGKKNKAIITKKGVDVDGKKLSNKQFEEQVENSKWGGNTDFYLIVETIRRNFDDIAEIDFAKRVYLKENANIAADIFKLRDNVFITTHDPLDGKITFYRNINPIQAKHIMTEHLNYDVSRVFKDVLPDEKKILSDISETKKEYNEYIKSLNEKLDKFKSQPSTDVTIEVTQALDEELQDIKEEFKDYLHRAETYTRSPEHVDEDISVTIDVHGKKYTVPIPTEGEGEGGESEEGEGEEAGTEVGVEDIEDEPASAITFDDDETELLGDSPSMDSDEVNLGGDEAEADADAAEAEAETDKDKEEQEEEAEDNEDEEKSDEDDDEEKAKKSDDDDEDDEDDEEKAEESSEKSTDVPSKISKKKKVFLKKKKVQESDTRKKKITNKVNEADSHIVNKVSQLIYQSEQDPDYVSPNFVASIASEHNINLTSDDVVQISDGYDRWLSDNWPNNANESNDIESINENAQIGDTVIYDRQKGSIVGSIGNDVLVQVQGSTHQVSPKEVKVLGVESKTVTPPFKFDPQTQKLLFEQWVKCGIYMNNIPVKVNECYVRYSDWRDAKSEESINIMIEGKKNLLHKNQIKIFENENDFANLDNYVEGVVVDETTDEAIENVQINVVDYTNALGEADPVRILRNGDTPEPDTDTLPKGSLKTLSV